jgi:hypothetical protein
VAEAVPDAMIAALEEAVAVVDSVVGAKIADHAPARTANARKAADISAHAVTRRAAVRPHVTVVAPAPMAIALRSVTDVARDETADNHPVSAPLCAA